MDDDDVMLNIIGLPSCVRTCMIKVKPPPFFDWEETSVGDPLTEQGELNHGFIVIVSV